jgi:PAS domain S-box-containing protein
VNKKNPLIIVQECILKHVESDRATLLSAFCDCLAEAFHLTGAAVAIKEYEHFTIAARTALFPDRPFPEFTLAGHGTVSIAPCTNGTPDRSLEFVADSGGELILAIKPGRKKHYNPDEARSAADLLAAMLAGRKKQLALMNRYRAYMTIFRKSSNLAAILDPAGKVVEWNEAAEQLYGRALDEGPVTYKDFIDEDMIPETRELFAQLYRSFMSHRKALDRERLAADPEYRARVLARLARAGTHSGSVKLTSRDGEQSVDTDYTVSLMFDEETFGIGGCILTTTDITSRKNMREQMEETERKYRDLFNLMPLFSMLVDTAGSAVDYNFAIAGGLGPGAPPGEAVAYMDFIHPEDRARAAALFMDLLSRAAEIKNRRVGEKGITQEECAALLRGLAIIGEPLRLVAPGSDAVYETAFSARLWLGEDLEIRGALLSAIDVTELNACRRRLDESERKYRELLNKKTRDIIFSLDGRGRIILVNSNIKEKLGYAEEAVIGHNIVDILYRDPIDKNNINRETFRENIGRVLKDGATDVRFSAVCDHSRIGEPVTLQFILDPIVESGAVTGVMGFASEPSDDPLLDFVREEMLACDIDNRITIADEVSFRVTRNLARHLPDGRVSLVRLGVREMIVNAIEHGNLGITYEEKTQSQKNQTYLELLRERQRNEENRNKKVHITYRLDETGAVYTVRDEGNGFNYDSYFGLDVRTLNERMIQHGRGILITRSVFDEVQYNEKGNEVNLAVYFRK